MADRLAGRRATTNAFFATLNAALLTAVGLLREPKVAPELGTTLGAVAGILLSLLWFLTLRSYRQLSKSKWEVVNAMEEHLPSQPFTKEWQQLPHDSPRRRDRYYPLGTSETLVPLLFALVYAAVLSVTTVIPAASGLWREMAARWL